MAIQPDYFKDSYEIYCYFDFATFICDKTNTKEHFSAWEHIDG